MGTWYSLKLEWLIRQFKKNIHKKKWRNPLFFFNQEKTLLYRQLPIHSETIEHQYTMSHGQSDASLTHAQHFYKETLLLSRLIIRDLLDWLHNLTPGKTEIQTSSYIRKSYLFSDTHPNFYTYSLIYFSKFTSLCFIFSFLLETALHFMVQTCLK